MIRAAITGGSGFVGSNLVRRLLRDGCETHLLVRPSYRKWRLEEVSDRIHIHEVDLEDSAAVKQVIQNIQPQWVFNLAAYGAYSTQTEFRTMLESNVLACATLVDACAAARVEVFVQAGSSSEYGYKDHAAMEHEAVAPNSQYALTKLAATHYCQLAAQSNNLNTVIVRLYSIYGPFEEPTRLVPTLIVHGLSGELPPLVSPNIARDFVHVDDAVDALVRVAALKPARPGAIYNVCSGTQSSLESVVHILQRLLQVRSEPVWKSMPDRLWDTETWVGSPNRMIEEVGWRCETDLERGLTRTIDWFRTNPQWLHFYSSQSQRRGVNR